VYFNQVLLLDGSFSLTGMRSFVAVVDAGGVRAAAGNIGRTPSAVMTLKQLEENIGAPLFEGERKSNLSLVGRMVLEEARAVIAHYERAGSAMMTLAANNLGRCDIASVFSVAVTLLPRATTRARKAGAWFDIHVRDIDWTAILDAIDNGMVEVGLCALGAKRSDLNFTPLFCEPLDFVCRADHPLAEAKSPLKWSRLEGSLDPQRQRLAARAPRNGRARRAFETGRKQCQLESRYGRMRPRRHDPAAALPVEVQL
jgi:LysR family carnitine catabolism transcriptional activator